MAKKKKKVEEEVKEEIVEEEEVVDDDEEIDEEEVEESEEDSDEDIDEEDDSDEDDDDSDDEDEENEDEEEEEVVESEPLKSSMSDKTRYIIISVIAFLLVGLIVVLAILGNDGNKLANSVTNSSESRNTSTEALKEFYEEFDSKDLNVIFFASSTCGFCSLEKPILKNIAEDYDMKYYEIDASTLSQSEITEMVSAMGIQGATPTTVIVKDGKVLATNEGYLDGKPYVEFFVKNGVLDKDATYKEEKNLKLISYDEFKKVSKKDKTSLILLDNSACQNCITVRSMLNELAEKNDFEVNYLFASSLSQDDINNLVEDDLKDMKYDEKEYKKDGTVSIPLLLVVKNNKIKDYVVSSSEESDYTKVLKKYGFIE